ncbi:hypothetical protein BO86DRAFT_168543 [Aspergillus japonicus CBS 114.51]|uniref:Uncharacterized protein n=2 Tax=Aspergillus TaxID=5052 RepID=A0A2V5HMU1_ASPV1|nr:hypothetical protein BO86DRAFT_168543 [Aspergillus japonicus CBS 114.51]PYI23902.1 hypothetical protein BO99DRAFT_156330 [Aspergillus violaceofuscus CBS 115571]RAH79008.1 hypothetical protein BO86DRAFT_168543 [Aspergillus japonicus CBS 114.51]
MEPSPAVLAPMPLSLAWDGRFGWVQLNWIAGSFFVLVSGSGLRLNSVWSPPDPWLGLFFIQCEQYLYSTVHVLTFPHFDYFRLRI